MCGIAGFLRTDGAPAEETRLASMLARLVHRGPDDEGRHVAGPVALGTRRLSIIDVAGGHQPLSSEDGQVWAALNGEIYNYRELRAELEAAGHRFATGSDTETLVHLYEEHGDGFLARLNGMFGLALWDARRRRLLLARDRVGIKPLYFRAEARELAFASEPKALLAPDAAASGIDLDAARDYLQLGYVPAPGSIFRGVRKLQPGHSAVLEGGRLEVRAYWTIPDEAPSREAFEEKLGRFQALFRDAVALQMRSDVPYGAFLSGGIDSSAVVGTMAGLSTEPVRTFSIGFAASRRYDELPWARLVAGRFGTRHEEFVVEPRVFDLLADMTFHFDEPFADAAFVPTFVLSGLTRQGVKVALSGDGGDELFAGYDRYRSEALADAAAWIPGLLRRGVLAPLLRALPLPADGTAGDWVRQAARKLDLAGLAPDERYVSHFLLWGAEDWQAVQGDALRELRSPGVAERYLSVMAAPRHADFLNRRLVFDQRTWLPDQMLTKVDRASMARGLEVRVPFLDHRIVEFAARLSQRDRFRFLQLKRFLKAAFRALLPAELLARPKHGFEVPIGEWLRGPLRGFLRDHLAPERLRAHGLMAPAFVERMLREHETRTRNRSRELFAVLVFQLWYDRWQSKPPANGS
jgi:asparagine synthase (glutamine-hydrolysing)